MFGAKKLSAVRLVTLAVVFVVSYWQWERPWLYPLRILTTLFHELGHGLAGIATGGRIDHIEIDAMTGGLCFVYGGWRWLVLMAGYLGSVVSGCAIILAACRTRFDKQISLGLGMMVIVATLLWVRTSIGFTYGILSGVVLASAGWWLGEGLNEFMLCMIGAMDCMASLFGLKYLYTFHGNNDAQMFSKEILPLPQEVWATFWVVLSALCLAATLRVALRDDPKKA